MAEMGKVSAVFTSKPPNYSHSVCQQEYNFPSSPPVGFSLISSCWSLVRKLICAVFVKIIFRGTLDLINGVSCTHWVPFHKVSQLFIIANEYVTRRPTTNN